MAGNARYANAQLHLDVGEGVIHHVNMESEHPQNPNIRAAQKLALAAVSNVVLSSAKRSFPVTGGILLAGSGYYSTKPLISWLTLKAKAKPRAKDRSKNFPDVQRVDPAIGPDSFRHHLHCHLFLNKATLNRAYC
ncbi:unnamed protein product (mitochondrion) [Plasmodiophora brassicae]|uniref:Uncharacterized protein n=1 Tax=Plasmodiophora brassicae TaxID=37360 RepID=A0A0G4IYU5_PLABS|nr:hypothetical protein PBRA_001587 [Plasmodiophora brassicae]SPQ93970.1 unnamed protein product [Plasmodiophora brassicae]